MYTGGFKMKMSKEFIEKINKRLEVGELEYGKDKFMNQKLENEVEEEILDICAWSFLLFTKLQRLREKLK